jgi:hypothetical protein
VSQETTEKVCGWKENTSWTTVMTRRIANNDMADVSSFVYCHLAPRLSDFLHNQNHPQKTLETTMAIAPITGMLRKRFWVDMSCALGLGTAFGYAYWYVSTYTIY